jgi:hypothetical protein
VRVDRWRLGEIVGKVQSRVNLVVWVEVGSDLVLGWIIMKMGLVFGPGRECRGPDKHITGRVVGQSLHHPGEA